MSIVFIFKKLALTLVANVSCTVFLIKSFSTTLLGLHNPEGTVFSLSTSILSTCDFKLAICDFSAK